MLKPLLFLTGCLLAATVSGTAQQPQIPKKDSLKREPVFSRVDQMPEFIGNMDTFINQHLQYPEDARKAKLEGRVVIKVVIEPDGRVSTPSVERSVSPALDAEAIRVVRLMPPWKPGKQYGYAVPIMYHIPVTFKLL
jgi:protein TonB